MKHLLRAQDISFAYDQRQVLRSVNVSLDEGQIVVLLGPNGSGKSTLIKSLLGDLVAHGSILWQGRELPRWKRRDLAKVVAYLPQSPAFDPEQRVSEVLRLGRAPYLGAFGLESLRDLEVVHRVANQLGMNDLLGRRMDEISGGQRQIVFLGRSLVQEPHAMLLDEPNTFLDLKHQMEMCRLLTMLAREHRIGVLMASHDLNLSGAFADQLVLLHEGSIVAAGTPGEVLRADLLSKVYGVEVQTIHRPDSQVPLVFPVQ